MADASNYEMKDMGKHHDFETGGTRDIDPLLKGRYDLIHPAFMHRLAVVMGKGAVKYDARNWEKGIPLHSMVDSCIRHMYQFLNGDTDEDHLGHAAANLNMLAGILHAIERGNLPESLNDLPDYTLENDTEGYYKMITKEKKVED